MISRYEDSLIRDIITRALALPAFQGYERIQLHMSLEACHETTPLRLHKLLDCSDADFIHDVGGIYNHINHNTRKLDDIFHPRLAL